MSLTDVIVGAVRGIAGRLIGAKYEWRRHIDFEIIKKVYEPLHTKIIEYLKFIVDFIEIPPGSYETFVRGIKDNYWYSRVSKKVAEKFQEWQSRVSEYNAIRKDMRGKIEKAINQEIEKRETALEPSPDKNHIVFEFKGIITEEFFNSMTTAPSRLLQGKINDEEYHFIDNFKRRGKPSAREIRAKLASGFAKAIYEEIQKATLFADLHKKVEEIKNVTARLREVLEKRIKK